jgi:hypothetical protein
MGHSSAQFKEQAFSVLAPTSIHKQVVVSKRGQQKAKGQFE